MEQDRFDMFCLYYLGLNAKGEYRFLNANQIAKEYNWTVDQLMSTLRKLKIHPDTVLNTDFPMARHQVDIQMASEEYSSADLKKMADRIYEDFVAALGKPRDWLGEIEREREEDREASLERKFNNR